MLDLIDDNLSEEWKKASPEVRREALDIFAKARDVATDYFRSFEHLPPVDPVTNLQEALARANRLDAKLAGHVETRAKAAALVQLALRRAAAIALEFALASIQNGKIS